MDAPSFTASFLNRKGGVGKTSSVFHLAGSFARSGRRVLGLRPRPAGLAQPGLLRAPLRRVRCRSGRRSRPSSTTPTTRSPRTSSTRRPSPTSGSSRPRTTSPTTTRRGPRTPRARMRSGDFLAEVGSSFDVILIDCPPNLQLCSWAALARERLRGRARHPRGLLLPGAHLRPAGHRPGHDRRNPRLRLLGYVLTMYNRQLGIHKAYEKLLREQYRDLVLENVFPIATAFKEAVTRRRPIAEDKPKSAAAEAVHGPRPGDLRAGPPSTGRSRRSSTTPGTATCPGWPSPRSRCWSTSRSVPGEDA